MSEQNNEGGDVEREEDLEERREWEAISQARGCRVDKGDNSHALERPRLAQYRRVTDKWEQYS